MSLRHRGKFPCFPSGRRRARPLKRGDAKCRNCRSAQFTLQHEKRAPPEPKRNNLFEALEAAAVLVRATKSFLLHEPDQSLGRILGSFDSQFSLNHGGRCVFAQNPVQGVIKLIGHPPPKMCKNPNTPAPHRNRISLSRCTCVRIGRDARTNPGDQLVKLIGHRPRGRLMSQSRKALLQEHKIDGGVGVSV